LRSFPKEVLRVINDPFPVDAKVNGCKNCHENSSSTVYPHPFFFAGPKYTKRPPLGIPEGIKKYMKSPVLTTLKYNIARIRSIK